MFNKDLYNDEVFAWHKKYAEEYELKTGQLLFDTYKPKSVVDFGCGIATYLQAAHDLGIVVKGFDIGGEFASNYVSKELLPFIDFYADITAPMNVGSFDIVMCIEVAEHVEPNGSFTLIKNLVNATKKMCIFTAAPPGQEGHQHINCRPKQDWLDMFASLGMNYDKTNQQIICDLWKDAPKYILDNLCVLIK